VKQYIDGIIRDYLDDGAKGQPTPGGGSISATAGALGAAMGCMAANFTVGKKKFRKVSAEVEEILTAIDAARIRLADLADADVAAYGDYKAAQDMPKETDEEQAARKSAIQKALAGAMAVPLEVMRQCLAILDTTARLAVIGNPYLVTDVAVCAILAEAAVRGAAYNVLINAAYLADKEAAAKAQRQTADARARAAACLNRTIEAVDKVLDES